MTALTLLTNPHHGRQHRDRLEILTTLIDAPSFEEWLRPDVIGFPPQHPDYAWQCAIDDCQRPRTSMHDLCSIHQRHWQETRLSGGTRADFLVTARPLQLIGRYAESMCLICGNRPAQPRADAPLLCHRHRIRWARHRKAVGIDADFTVWRMEEIAYPGWGPCIAHCTNTAQGPLGLCPAHHVRYVRQGRPGGAVVLDAGRDRVTPSWPDRRSLIRRRSSGGAARTRRCSDPGSCR